MRGYLNLEPLAWTYLQRQFLWAVREGVMVINKHSATNRGTTLPVSDRAGDSHYLRRHIDPWRLVRVRVMEPDQK